MAPPSVLRRLGLCWLLEKPSSYLSFQNVQE